MSTSNTPPLKDIPRHTMITEAGPSFIRMECDGRSGNLALEQQMAKFLGQAFEIFKERQKKYGSNNIAKRGARGVVVRMDDKLSRLDQLVAGKGMGAYDETTMDTCIDIANYAAIAFICLNKGWPNYEVV